MTLFDLHIHEEQKLTSMEGFDLRGSSPDFRPTKKARFPKAEIGRVARRGGNAGAIGQTLPKPGQSR